MYDDYGSGRPSRNEVDDIAAAQADAEHYCTLIEGTARAWREHGDLASRQKLRDALDAAQAALWGPGGGLRPQGHLTAPAQEAVQAARERVTAAITAATGRETGQ